MSYYSREPALLIATLDAVRFDRQLVLDRESDVRARYARCRSISDETGRGFEYWVCNNKTVRIIGLCASHTTSLAATKPYNDADRVYCLFSVLKTNQIRQDLNSNNYFF